MSLHRRQFLLTRERCDALAHWPVAQIGPFRLYTHPDLPVAIDATDGVALALLGYAIDPDRPEQDDAGLLHGLIGLSVDDIGHALASLSGRYVIIRAANDDVWLWNDPCGLRTVCYTRDAQGWPMAASQPLLFGYMQPLREAPYAESYWRSTHVAKVDQHWPPSGITLYEGVSHLTPNHYLRGSTVEAVRYWPARPLGTRPARAVAEDAARLLQRQIAAAAHRWPLGLPLTAGWDSRTLLAASRPFASSLHCSTMRLDGFTDETPDIAIPTRICAALGLPYRVQECESSAPADFAELFAKHTAMAHQSRVHWVYGAARSDLTANATARGVTINGSCAEIARCFYYASGVHAPISSGDDLVRRVTGWTGIAFVHERMADWYRQTAPISQGFGVDLLDLFYWEHRLGSWHGQSGLEFDLAAELESFSPYNHRGLLELLLSVPARYRSAPDYPLQRAIIRRLWPELLRFPINPVKQSWRQQAKNRLKRLAKLTGLYPRQAH